MSVESLPDFSLSAQSPVGELFLSRGLTTFREAAACVRDFPYGRNTDRSEWRSVLSERRGTCSTKHALLAELAKEHGSHVKLHLGIYEMGEANTPGVGAVLERHGLDRIPEAHCYLTYGGKRIDLTDAETVGISEFLHEEEIVPEQTGAYKVGLHKRFVREWAISEGLDPETVWRAREKCIAALSTAGG